MKKIKKIIWLMLHLVFVFFSLAGLGFCLHIEDTNWYALTVIFGTPLIVLIIKDTKNENKF